MQRVEHSRMPEEVNTTSSLMKMKSHHDHYNVHTIYIFGIAVFILSLCLGVSCIINVVVMWRLKLSKKKLISARQRQDDSTLNPCWSTLSPEPLCTAATINRSEPARPLPQPLMHEENVYDDVNLNSNSQPEEEVGTEKFVN
ncbi:hypothetical protein B566_EDAN003789 [Ephemera danica]|nr:hypothetical protein B566_EDAN003789 [Ephemera danica]